MKTIVAKISVPDRKASDATGRMEKNLHILAQSLRLRKPDASVTEGEAIQVNSRELSTILAALRYWQRLTSYAQRAGHGTGTIPEESMIARMGHSGQAKGTVFFSPLEDSEIDGLCERINCGETASPSEVANVLAQVAETFYQLAENAGDVDEWNEGGHAYESSAAVRELRKKLPISV